VAVATGAAAAAAVAMGAAVVAAAALGRVKVMEAEAAPEGGLQVVPEAVTEAAAREVVVRAREVVVKALVTWGVEAKGEAGTVAEATDAVVMEEAAVQAVVR